MIDPFSKPSPLTCDLGTRETIVDVHTINIDCCSLTERAKRVTQDNGEGLVLRRFDVACRGVCQWLDCGGVFWKGVGCVCVKNGGLEAVVDGHRGGVG